MLVLNVNDNQPNNQRSLPIGLVIGPRVTFGNMVWAEHANEALLAEFDAYDLSNIEIKKGETGYGLIGFQNIWYDTLSIKRIELQK